LLLAGCLAGWLAGSLTGCLARPESGPVSEIDDAAAEQVEAPADIVVRPPQVGESARDIVVHFLDAMEASPISTTVAREYLSQEAAASWNPALGTIVYSAKSAPVGSSTVSITLNDAGRLDERGSWQGALPEAESTLRFPLVREDGEWRISAAPDALIVRDSWFAQRFSQFSVYFLDPTGQVLVPEPVYLPTGDQLPSYLVAGLLAGPQPQLRDVERSYLPEGITASPVTVSDQGGVEIALQGDGARVTPQTAEPLFAQLTWTLRQVPGVRYVSVTVGGEPLRLVGGGTEVPIDQGVQFDPSGLSAPNVPFALRGGLLVTGSLGDMQPVNGPFGSEDLGLRSIAVDPGPNGAAGVTSGGDRVLVADLNGSASAPVQEVVQRATDLLKPAWDLSGRLWLVDRRKGGALVSVVVGDRVRPVSFPGITGENVTSFVVSRDGSRLVAVVRGPAGDEVRQSRIRVDDRGLLSGTRARALAEAGHSRVRDLAWSSPTSLLLLAPLAEGIAEVRSVSVDDSPSRGLATGTTLRGNMRWLAGSPVEGEPWYAVSVSPRSVVDENDVPVTGSLDGVALPTLTYAG
jgi:hypothetical protein